MNSKEKKEWIKKLKPFWKRREKIASELFRKEHAIQQEMCKKLGEDLEFFYCDGECVGIGHTDFRKRNKFPLFNDSELNR
ncbi:MAG: hypothetical protein V1870_01085 [Candidatus Aenigmatarchaeota archaeon]